MFERAHIVHITPTFTAGGAQMRVAQIMNHFGDRFRHTVLAMSDDFSGADRVAGEIDVEYVRVPKYGNPVRMVRALAAVLKRENPQLVLTYNWGSLDGVMAALLFGSAPVIHTEDGFGDDEAVRQKRRRVLCRRMFLRGAHRVVAPSRNLARIMKDVWRLPAERIRYIPNGIDLERFAPQPGRRSGPLVIGTVGQLRPEKRQDMLIEACAAAAHTHDIRLVIAGDGPERPRLEQRARDLNFADRTEFLGHVANVSGLYPNFDIFALSSSTEQMPISVLEAMACGLPVLSTDVGDVKHNVSAANRAFVVPGENYQQALNQLVEDAALRKQLGIDNRTHCRETYRLERMLREYEDLYNGALGVGAPAMSCS